MVFLPFIGEWIPDRDIFLMAGMPLHYNLGALGAGCFIFSQL
jgi:hypothetical protein